MIHTKTLVVDSLGAVVETDVIWEPYRLVDSGGGVVASVTQFLHELQAGGRSPSTQRSYALDLLRWFRFLWAVGVPWGQATRCEARDFCRWLLIAGKPGADGGYAAATAAHCETVLRHFYDFHLEAGTGPMVNPFPLARGRAGRPGAHRNPMDPSPRSQAGLFRPMTVVTQAVSFEGLLQAGAAPAAFALPQAHLEAQAAEPRRVHDPAHPHADAQGMVAYPGVSHAREMVNLVAALRSYEANVMAANATRALAARALDIGGSQP